MDKIEKEFNEKAKQIFIQPSESAWPALHERMSKKKKKGPKFIHMKWYISIVTIIGILLICFVTFLVIRIHSNRSTKTTNPPIQIQTKDSVPTNQQDTTKH